MKFSLFFEMQISDPTRASESRLFQNTVEQAVLADMLGYHRVWAVEHHGLYEYAHSAAPEIFLSFVAARTKNIRIGHGVSLTAKGYNHPIRVAERVATLDILSGGRVDWGSGKSSSNLEAPLFGINPADLEGQWREAIEMIPQMWQKDVFSWESANYSIPPTHIVPKPVQAPHPPLFAPAAVSTETIRKLGTMGLGVLNFSTSTFDDLKNRVAMYRDAVTASTVSGRAINNSFSVTANTCVLDDDDMACAHGFRGARYFRDSFAQYYHQSDRPQIGRLPVDRSEWSPRMLEMTKSMRFNEQSQLLSIVGDPQVAREKVAIFEAAGIDELILVMQLGTVPHEITMQSIRTFAEKVMPYFAKDTDLVTTQFA
ncbi:LLM class flavin-dependent oxidoreductase [Sphingobium sufflavum]|uniref:LLM class flavin-dependent oxidoreductase n=1 Tax=Sphingobium sufflavum TaxID=1129547 RepID=UPI001F2D7702|nr:LLM class flavin-dependent oxidoreductase [Sphingobium sufflavum]MCE7797229.1 LLM class flavin-dependent oxidoreductase [Sphingobium sufflavum]